MQPVKVNIYISYVPEDKPQLDKLLRWLYPMRDEVNIWYNSPPPPPPELPLPWQILLFWYTPPDSREKYRQVMQARRERSHIYLFLTSYKSLSNKQIEEDIDVAANRAVDGDAILGPFVFPVILSPSRWQEESRLAGFKPLADGVPLSLFKPEEEGYLTMTEEIAALLKVLQPRLGEVKFYQSRLSKTEQGKSGQVNKSIPYLGESDHLLKFNAANAFQPPEWLGWSLILFIFISVISSLMPTRILGPGRYENIKSANDHGLEYRRENPMVQPNDTIVLPPSD